MNHQDGNHMTPLMHASTLGSVFTARALIANGADARVRDANGLNALMLAVTRDHAAIVTLLAHAFHGLQSAVACVHAGRMNSSTENTLRDSYLRYAMAVGGTGHGLGQHLACWSRYGLQRGPSQFAIMLGAPAAKAFSA